MRKEPAEMDRFVNNKQGHNFVRTQNDRQCYIFKQRYRY